MLSALLALAAIQGLAALTWFWSLKRHDMSVADIFWPLYHVVAAIIFFTVSGQDDLFAAAVLGLIIIWGLRLALHIGARQMGKGEDHRYTAARRTKDDRFPHTSLYIIFMPQALMAWGVSLVLLPILNYTGEASWSQWMFLALALGGLIFEVMADLQLTRFRAEMPASAVLSSGLWRYSRHPNYFGEWLFWLGICLVSMHHSVLWPILAMALLTFLLTRFTGVKRMESDIEQRRPGYTHYVTSTSSFFPWRQLIIAGVVIFTVTPDVSANDTTPAGYAASSGHTNYAQGEPAQENFSGKTETWRFKAFIDKKEVGYHSFKAYYHSSGIRLEGEAKFEYKLLGITLFSYEHAVVEEYDNNYCLQKITSNTQIRDKSLSLQGNLTPQGFAVDAPTNEIHDTQCVVPFAYWAPTFVAQSELLNGQTGELVPVSITPESQLNDLETSYRVETDEMSLAVRYDATGNWIGLISDLPAKRKLIYKIQIYKTENQDFLTTVE
jgi:steroid 5-alpha reductase family enzyme